MKLLDAVKLQSTLKPVVALEKDKSLEDGEIEPESLLDSSITPAGGACLSTANATPLKVN